MSLIDDYIRSKCEDSDRHLECSLMKTYIEITELDSGVFTVQMSRDEMKRHLSILTEEQFWDLIMHKLDNLHATR